MNYILNETTPQFFLNEKFDLCERFILNEDERPASLEKWAIETRETLSTLYKGVVSKITKNTASKESDLNKIFNYLSSLKNLINQKIDPTKLKPKVVDFIDKFENALSTIGGTNWENNLGTSTEAKNFTKSLKDILTSARNSSYEENTIKKLVNDINTLYNSSKTLIKNYSDSDTTSDDILQAINEFKNAYEDFILCCDVISKLANRNILGKDLEADFLEFAQNLYSSKTSGINKGLVNSLAQEHSLERQLELLKKNGFSNFAKEVKSFTDKYSSSLKTLAKEYKIDTRDTSKALDTKDWDKTYKDWPKDNKSQEEFWNLYYKNVWGSDAQKVAYLGEAFRQELTSWGFTENHNPFITFVKKYLIDKKYNITGEHYEKLHNAVVYGKVPRNLLKCTIDRHRNVIFNRTAYAGSANDFEEYLDAQYTIAGTTGDANISPLKEILFTMNLTPETANSSTGHLSIIAAIMFGNADAPAETMKNFKVADWEKADWEELKINSVQTIKSLLNDYIGGEVSNKVKIATISKLGTAGKELAKSAIDGTADGIIKLSKMYSFLIRLWAPDKIDDLLNKYKLRADSDQNVQDAINRNNLKVGQTINDIVTAKNGFNIADIEEFTKVLSKIGNVTSTTALQSIDTIITSGGIFGA